MNFRSRSPKPKRSTRPIARDARRRRALAPRLLVDALEERKLMAASVNIDGADALAFQANATGTVHVSYSGGVYTISDNAEVINVTNNGTGTVTGNGTNTITVTNTTSLDIDLHGTSSSAILDSTGNQPVLLHDTTGGGDFFQIGSGGSAQGVLGPVTIGSSTSASTVAVDNQTDPTGRTVTVSSSGVTGLTPSTIDVTNANLSNLALFNGTGADTITVTGTHAPTTLQGNTLGDTVNVQGTNAGASLTVGGTQGETINIGNAGSVQGILGTVTVSNNNNGSTVTVDDSADSTARNVSVGSVTLSGLAPAAINFLGSEPTTIKGGAGGNTFTITGTPGNPSTLFTGTGDDTVNVQTTDAGRPLTIHGQGGTDTVNVGSAGNLLSTISSSVTVDNASGQTGLVINDSADALARTPTITDAQVTGFAPAGISYSGLSSLRLMGGSGGGTFTINNGGTSTFPTSIVAGSGDDTFALMGTSDLGGGTIDGGGGTNTLDYNDYTVAFSVDLTAGTATGTGGVSNIQDVVPTMGTATALTGTPDPTVSGQPVTFTATVAPAVSTSAVPTGTVDFMDGPTLLATVPLDAGGRASLTTPSLIVGGHAITAVYSGDSSFATSTSPVFVQGVSKDTISASLSSSASPSAYGQLLTLSASVAAASPGSGVPTGLVQLLDGASVIGIAALDASGNATFHVATLAVGSHSLSLSFAGDDNFQAGTSAPLGQTVNAADTTATLGTSATPAVSGQSVALTATIAPVAPGDGTPGGSVDFFDGATLLGSAPVDVFGRATLNIASLSLGSHAITAVYSGDGSFNGSESGLLTQDVNQAGSTASVASSASPSAFGQPVTFTATIAAAAPGSGTPTGTVDFFDGATLLGTATLDASGQAAITTSSLDLGGHAITVSYSGDANFLASGSSVMNEVVEQASTVSLTGTSGSPTTFGEPVTLTATVSAASPGSGTPTGTVSFFDGANWLGAAALDISGTASLTTSSLSAGSHAITAVYSGDTDFATSTSPAATQDVNQADTATTVSTSGTPTVAGQAASFTATVSALSPGAGVPTGTVTFLDGAAPIGTATLDASGVATISTAGLAVGSHAITAVYNGDANFAGGSWSEINQDVNQAATATSMVIPTGPSVFGQPVTLTVQVEASAPGSGVPTGTIDFIDGPNLIGSAVLDGTGQAQWTLSGLSVGAHNLQAIYLGDGSFLGGASGVVSQTVGQSGTTANLVAVANPTMYGQPAIFTATVAAASPGSGTPTGSVIFLDGATVLGTALLDASGRATLAISSLSAGGHSITAVYSGDPNFEGSASASAVQAVNQVGTTSALASSTPSAAVGQPITFTATVAASVGSATPTGQVFFKDGATILGSATIGAGGVATFTTTTLAPGAHSILAEYTGGANFGASASVPVGESVVQAGSTTALSTSANPSALGSSLTFTATVAGVGPNVGTPTGTVTFKDGSATLGTAPLVGGVATFSTSSLSIGSHAITAAYSGDAGFSASGSSAVSESIARASATATVAASASASVFGQLVTLMANVSPSASGLGMPTGTVTFLDGSTAIGTAALSGGSAHLSLANFSVGTHSIRAVYSGDAQFAAVTSSALAETVNKASATAVLMSSGGSSVFGQPVTFTAVVNVNAPGVATPTGTVTFRDGSTVLGTASLVGHAASLATGSLGVGSHTITATYDGDAHVLASTAAPMAQSVGQAATVTQLFSMPNPVVSGQTATFVAVVTPSAPGAGNPAGIVAFYDGFRLIGGAFVQNGWATLNVPMTGAGQAHPITAVYLGDGRFSGSYSPALNEVVVKANTQVGLSAGEAQPGGGTAVNAKVYVVNPGGGVPTGEVAFRLNGRTVRTANLVNGQASVSLNGLGATGRSLSVQYMGDAEFNGNALSVLVTRDLFRASVRPASVFSRSRGRGR